MAGVHDVAPLVSGGSGDRRRLRQRPNDEGFRVGRCERTLAGAHLAGAPLQDDLDLLDAEPPSRDGRRTSKHLPPMPLSPATLEEHFHEQVAAADMGFFYKAIRRHAAARRQVAPLPREPSPSPFLSASAPALETSSVPAFESPAAPAASAAGSPVPALPRSTFLAARVRSPGARLARDDADLDAARALHRRWAAETGLMRQVEHRGNAILFHALGAEARLAIEATKRTLPLNFLRLHEMGDVAARESAAKMNRAMRKLLSQAFASAWARWLHFLDSERLRDLDTAARLVQRAWRGGEARQAVRTAQRAKAKELARARARAAKLAARRRDAVRLITATLRRYRTRSAGLVLAALVHSVRVVQRAWGNKKARRIGWSDIARHICEAEASIKIQRVFRGFAGRKRFKKRRQVLQHLKREERFNDARTTLKANFEMHGAAKRVQGWWARLPWRVRRRRRQLQLFYSMRLQCVVRKFLARRRLRLLRCRRFGASSPQDMGAMQLQRLARGMLARKRFGPAARWQALEELQAERLAQRFKKNSNLRGKMEKAAKLVQRVWRGTMARKAFEVAVMKRRGDKVAILQQAVCRFLKRRRRQSATQAMSGWFRRVFATHARRHSAAVAVQAAARRHRARSRFQEMQASMSKLSWRFVPVVRAFAARKAKVRDDARRAWAAEDKVAGAYFFHLSREDEIRRQILVTTRIDDPHRLGEVQGIFAHYCAFGQKGNSSRLGVNNFSKMMKECPGLIAAGALTSQECELMFTKSLLKLPGGGTESHLHYNEFIATLELIAAARLKKTEAWGPRLRGSDAKLVQLLQVFVMASPTAIKIAKSLKSQSAAGRADDFLRTLAMRIQRVYRCRAAHRQFQMKREGAATKKELLESFKAALLFQRFWHRFKAKRKVVEAAKLVWEKYVDAESNRPYWYNSRTGTAVWRKPAALGDDDLGNPVKMPKGPDVFTVECKSCAENLATTLCFDCGELHCVDCSRVMHGKGRRSNHEIIKTEVCVQCEFQVGCRYCFACKDDYCDTCFEDQHAKGMLQRHEYRPLVAVCEECGKRGARQVVHDNLPDKAPIRTLCNSCTALARPLAPRAKREPFPYHPFKIDLLMAAKAAEKERLEREEAFNLRKREARAALETKSATTIQRWLRGSWSRGANADFVAERKLWLQKRKVDDVKRRAAAYRLLLAMGIAPELESDTVFEKVLKRFPARNKDFIIDVVNGEWQRCYQLILDQDAHHKTAKASLSVVSQAIDSWKLSGAHATLSLKESVLAAKKRDADKAQLEYRNARSAVGKSEDARNELQQAMRLAKKEYDAAVAACDQARAGYDELAAKSRMRSGPRGMPKRIREVRLNGWPIPMKVTAKRSKDFLLPTVSGQQNLVKPGQYLRVEGSPAVYRVQDHPDKPGSMYMAYLGLTKRWVRLAAKLEGLDLTNPEDLKLVEARIPKWVKDEAAAKAVLLDRAWTFNSAKELQVYRLPRLSPYWAAVTAVKRGAKASRPAQATVVGLMRLLGWVASKYRGAADLFDEEAHWHSRLIQYAEATEARQTAASHLLHQLEPRVGALSLVADAKSLQRTVVRIASKVKGNIEKRRAAVAEAKRKATDPLQPFLDSKHQLEIIVAWNDGTAEGAELPLGFMKVDLDCPAGLGRQLLARYLWLELNERKGRNYFYQAEVKKEKVNLDVSQEQTTKLDGLVQQKLNTETRRVEYVLVLRPDTEAKEVDAIEPWDWEEEAKKQARPTTEAAGDEDEDDEPEEVRFKNVIAQKERHMEQLKRIRLEAKHAGLSLDEEENGSVRPGADDDSDDDLGSAGEGLDGPGADPKSPGWEQVQGGSGQMYH